MTHPIPEPLPELRLSLLTQTGVASALGLHRDTISKLTRAGVIPCIRIGLPGKTRTVRYSMQAVIEALANATAKPASK